MATVDGCGAQAGLSRRADLMDLRTLNRSSATSTLRTTVYVMPIEEALEPVG